MIWLKVLLIPTPQYVRAINVTNDTPEQIALKVNYKSDTSESFIIAPNKSKKVEKNISKNTFTVVDPITSIDVIEGDKETSLIFQPKGVEINDYLIKKENNNLLIKKITIK